VLVLALAGCGAAGIDFAQPAVDFTPAPEPDLGPTSIIAGVVEGGGFQALEAGDPLPIIHGFQGGRWIHVAMRVTGMRNRGRVRMVIDGVGTADYDIKMLRRSNLLEIFDLPIPVGREPRRTDEEVDALAGDSVTLELSYTVGETTLSQELDLVLSLGEH